MTMSGELPENPGEQDAGCTDTVTSNGAATSAPQEVETPQALPDSGGALVWPPEHFFTLDARHVRAERWGGMILSALLFAGIVIGIGIQVFAAGWQLVTTLILAGSLATLVGVTALGWLWPKWEFDRTRWRLNPSGLEIHKGVLWRHRIVVPLSRVQHADVTQGPLQRWYDIGTLVVHTAGTSNASVELQGIDHEGAVQLRDTIVRFRSGQDGH